MASSKRTWGRLWRRAPGAAFCVVGSLVVGLGLWRIVEIRDARNWPTTSGTVLRSETSGGFLYGYTVEGLTYESEWVLPSQIGARHVGESVTVHYDPSAPSENYLREAGVHATGERSLWLTPAWGALFLLAGIVLLTGRFHWLTVSGKPRILGQRADPLRAQGVLKAIPECSKLLARPTWDGVES